MKKLILLTAFAAVSAFSQPALAQSTQGAPGNS